MRIIDEAVLEDIALGAAVLGTGGGGDPYIGKLMARESIRRYGTVELYTLDELDAEDLVVPTAMMGAPTVMVEKIPNGDDIVNAFHSVGKYIGKPIRATMSIEAGGLNSVVPIYTAARLRLPMVDCDGMGRAFPEIQMVTHTLHGISATPFAMSDERGNTVIMETIDNHWDGDLRPQRDGKHGRDGHDCPVRRYGRRAARSGRARHHQPGAAHRRDHPQRPPA